MRSLTTPRLLLIPATVTALRADLESRPALAAALDVEVPASWPPEGLDPPAIQWTIDALESGRVPQEWGAYYIATRESHGERPLLVGLAGYKGGPEAGTVEIGYGILAEARRRGYALEAVNELIRVAFENDSVDRVIAHTLVGLVPSIGVLERSGFRFVGPGTDPHEPAAIQYELLRADWEAQRAEAPR